LDKVSSSAILKLFQIGNYITNETDDFRLQKYWCNIVHSLSFGFSAELFVYALASCSAAEIDFSLLSIQADPVKFILALPKRVFSEPFLSLLFPTLYYISDLSVDYFQYHARKAAQKQDRTPDFEIRIKKLIQLQEAQIIRILMERMQDATVPEFPTFVNTRLRRFPEIALSLVLEAFPLEFVPIFIQNNYLRDDMGDALFQDWRNFDLQQKLFVLYVGISLAIAKQKPMWEDHLTNCVKMDDVIEGLNDVPVEFLGKLEQIWSFASKYGELVLNVLSHQGHYITGKKRKRSNLDE